MGSEQSDKEIGDRSLDASLSLSRNAAAEFLAKMRTSRQFAIRSLDPLFRGTSVRVLRGSSSSLSATAVPQSGLCV